MAAFANDTLPDGWLACDGTAVNRTTYANLFSKIGTTYGSGDGSDTFNLPNLTDRFIQGNGTPGTVKSAGLPNISGHFSVRRTSYNWGYISTGSNGAFNVDSVYPGSTSDMVEQSNNGAEMQKIDFNASRSNSIYGNSTTVQPPALTMRFAIFAGHSTLFRWIRTV